MAQEGKKKSMIWVYFALAAALFWGMYGPVLHKGQVQLGNPLRALLCVGFAYFLVGVLLPGGMLASQGQLRNFTWSGIVNSSLGGALGALGAICIIWAFRNGGVPNYVMPLVFGLAPLINVLVTVVTHPPKEAPNPLLYVGYVLASAGAGLVLYYKPAG
ncbi:MAG: EamA family transporter [Bryobacteraceae bacterium]|nr:EamA family transporter [Bryobacteraceae bacterium]